MVSTLEHMQGKWKISDAFVWQILETTENEQPRLHKGSTKTLNYTTIKDRLLTVDQFDRQRSSNRCGQPKVQLPNLSTSRNDRVLQGRETNSFRSTEFSLSLRESFFFKSKVGQGHFLA